MIVIKIGGSVVDGLHPSAVADIKSTAEEYKLVIVHGGGKEVTATATKLGKEQKFVMSPGGVRAVIQTKRQQRYIQWSCQAS